MNRPRPSRFVALSFVALAASCASPEAAESRPALAYLDRPAEAWVADFKEADQPKREAAVDALAKMGPATLPLVMPELDDNDPHVRYAAVATVARFEADGLPAARPVAARVGDPDPSVRAHAAFALKQIGVGSAPEGLAPLCGALKDQDWYVRWRAVEALHVYGADAFPEGYDALRAIERIDRDWRVRKDAKIAADHIEAEHQRLDTQAFRRGRRRDAGSF